MNRVHIRIPQRVGDGTFFGTLVKTLGAQAIHNFLSSPAQVTVQGMHKAAILNPEPFFNSLMNDILRFRNLYPDVEVVFVD